MVLAETDGSTIVILLAVLAGLGHWLIRSLERLNRRQRTIYRTACTLGVISGLVFAGRDFVQQSSLSDAESLLQTIFLAVMSGGLASCGWYFVVAVLLFSWEYVLAVPLRAATALRQRTQQNRRQARADAESRQRNEQQRHDAERQRREAEGRRLHQKRREDARFACEHFYDRHSLELKDQFPQDRLHDYFERYLGDNQPADEVEQRAEKLRAMLQEFVDLHGNGKPRFANIVEIREFYHQERLRIDGSNMDDDLKGSLLSDLAREEELAIREFRQR